MTPMMRHADRLPQLGGERFLTDSGLETTLIYHEGRSLPAFSATHLHRDDAGEAYLSGYYDRHAAIAAEWGFGMVFETNTWRASPDWAAALGCTLPELAALNRRAVDFTQDCARTWRSQLPVVVSGVVGPRGDGYAPDRVMTAEVAAEYHSFQTAILAEGGVDQITAYTITTVPEAVGIVRAGVRAGLPVVISFTVETDGCLPTGQPLGEAITAVDRATAGAAAYFMVNCAHPSHFRAEIERGGAWLTRLRGLRANASCRSHAELEAMTTLDSGDPDALGEDYAALSRLLPGLVVMGGCCGTDHRHVAAIGRCCARAPHHGVA